MTAAGYRQAMATGKVRMFYGLNPDGVTRHTYSNGCQGVEQYCIGIPYMMVSTNSAGKAKQWSSWYYQDMYAFAAYLLAWERMPESTHVAKVFEVADGCVQDLGDEGNDAETGRGRLDFGCLASSAFKMSNPTVTVTQVSSTPESTLVAGKEQVSYLGKATAANALKNEFSRLGISAMVDRSQSAYEIKHEKYAWDGPSRFVFWLYNYDLLRSIHEREAGTQFLLNDMGLLYGLSISSLIVGESGKNYSALYKKTAENNLVYIETNPFYLGSSPQKRNWGMRNQETWLDSGLIENRGWIVSETGYDVNYVASGKWQLSKSVMRRSVDNPLHQLNDYRAEASKQPEDSRIVLMEENYERALATGKVRLFYGLNSDQSGRDPLFLDCTDFEEYCIGVPHPYNSQYAFGVYLQAWERMPETTHISAVFDIGDRCTEDLGTKGADADTGLGRLDIGCMAYEVYKVNLDPASATLTVAARVQGAPVASQADVQGSLPSFSASASSVDPSQQKFFDDFAQDLFAHLGNLWLPGGTDAGFAVGFPGDSFEGTYRPAHGKRTHYDFVVPSALYARSAGSIGLMGMASSGEVGIFTRIEGVDVSFSYARSEDFFGGSGSGDFSFDQVGNSRLMLHKQVLPEGDEHTLGVGGWVRHAAVSGGRGRLLDDLRGVEYGLSMNYGWQGQGGLRVEATAYGARFAGGEVELAGGDRFAIGASDWKWGVRFGGSYQF
ncbi:MAG: hypothetical protein OXC81_06215 [Betaproteobacteria bacterium]|nr:hypothetical protein [Betaproteobacteria bacterium]